jgi:hypothetical protein
MSLPEQQSFGFSSNKARRIVGKFDGGDISSDGGLMLVREAARRTRLIDKVARHVEDSRQRGKVRHEAATIIRQRVYGMCTGDEDLNDFEELRNDPLWQTACEVDTPFAGKSTLCRFENKADRKLAIGVHSVLVENFLASYREAPKEIILDFDATDDPVHGHQEGRFFHGYYDDYCFLPLYVFCGDMLLVAYLRESRQDAARHAAAILKLLVDRIRQEWPQVKIIMRADSGFCRDRILSWCDAHGVDYIIGLARNEVLLRESASYISEAQRLHGETGQRQRFFGGIIYGANSWKLKRHVICKAEHTDKGSNPRFVVTSLVGDEADLYERVFCGRGEMENRIKEQMMLFSDRTSAHRWWANQWRVLLSALAYTLIETIRRIGLAGTVFARTQCHGIRLKLIKLGAMIERTKSRVRLRLPSGYPHQLTFIECLRRLRPT